MSLLARCPVCSYNLRGLPVSHRCPECGFAYDENTVIWRPARPWKGHGVVLAMNAVWVVVLGLRLLSHWRGRAFPDPWDVFILGAVLAGLVYAILHIRAVNRRGRCVVVAPAGVFVRSANVETLIPWAEIVAVEAVERWVKEERDEHVARIKTGSSIGAVEVDKIFSTEGERAAFMRTVEARLREAAAEGGGTVLQGDRKPGVAETGAGGA